MKKAKYPPFSNGTEFMMWEEHNCDRCIKSSRYNEKTATYTKIRCAVQREIFDAMMGEPVSQRTYDICQKLRCPHIKTEWPKRTKKSKTQKIDGQLEFNF